MTTTTDASTNRIEKSTDLKAPIERVWCALTDYQEFGTWFRVKLDGPFILGKISTGHISYAGYEHLKWEATIKQMEAPHLFALTWHPYAVDTTVDYSKETPTLVEFRLEKIPDGTRLTVVETGFDSLPPHRKPDALRMNSNGWEIQLTNIQAHVTN
jgi:uncharacterized protein YndB with AHSA1/START domain